MFSTSVIGNIAANAESIARRAELFHRPPFGGAPLSANKHGGCAGSGECSSSGSADSAAVAGYDCHFTGEFEHGPSLRLSHCRSPAGQQQPRA
jgi:hypothetical protein